MINTEIISIPAYTTREFMNFGLHKANTLYNFKYTPAENNLLRTGAIKLLPDSMLVYTALKDFQTSDKNYKSGDIVDVSSYDNQTKRVLITNKIISCELKDKDLSIEQIIAKANISDCAGRTFKKVSEEYNLDFDTVKKVFDLKQGANTKKIKETDLDKLIQLIEA